MKKKIALKYAGQRLDKVLADLKLVSTRSAGQKLFAGKVVLINDKPASAHLAVKVGDKLEILPLPEKAVKAVPAEQIRNWDKKIEIIADTKDYLVINKPAGLLVHESAATPGETTLADWLVKHYPKVDHVGDDPARPGIVHRLDRDVSGLMVIAKNQDSFDDLKKQFQKRTINKYYTALVYGHMPKQTGEINFKIGRATVGFKMAARPENQAGKVAVTEYEVLKSFEHYDLLRLKIKTGRTHQIRVHLSAADHPVVGDNLYGNRLTKEKNKKLALQRIFLVARELSFTDLNGEVQNFTIDLPLSLQQILQSIK